MKKYYYALVKDLYKMSEYDLMGINRAKHMYVYSNKIIKVYIDDMHHLTRGYTYMSESTINNYNWNWKEIWFEWVMNETEYLKTKLDMLDEK